MTDSLLTPVRDSCPSTARDALAGAGPWLGLTDDDAARINAAIAAAYAETTRAVYGFAWRRWVRRIIGRAPRRPVRPPSVADMRQIVTATDRTTVRGARDTALLLIGFAGARDHEGAHRPRPRAVMTDAGP
jgi:hypothetical protein